MPDLRGLMSRSRSSSQRESGSASSSSKSKGSLMPQLDPKKKGESSRMHTLDSSRSRTESSSHQTSTTYTSKYDQQMASRQTRIATLSPIDRQEQEKWAQSKLSQSAGACLDGYGWERAEICAQTGGMRGYRCTGGGHFVTDDLLAEGTKKCYVVHVLHYPYTHFADERWYGPFSDSDIYGSFGGSKEKYQDRFQSARRMRQATMRNFQIVSSRYIPGPFPRSAPGDSYFG